MNLGNVLDEVDIELGFARKKFRNMASPHEAYAVIKEEVDEFWEAIRTKGVPHHEARAELVQIAAMAVRAIEDCYGD